MIDIEFQNISGWYGAMLEQKYRERFSLMRKNMSQFYNLADQISLLYYTILKQSQKIDLDDQLPQPSKNQQQKSFHTIIQKSLQILTKMTETKTHPIQKSTCQKLINNFQSNLSLFCTYYHSLGHCDIMKNKFIQENKKIVLGINTLYNYHTRIKDLYRNRHLNQLKAISHQKRIIVSSRKVIMEKIQALRVKSYQIEALEKVMGELYQQFGEAIEKIQENSQPLRKIVVSYLKIQEQFYQAQAQLQTMLMPLLDYSEQLKQKKKGAPGSLSDTLNTFIRVSSQLLKPNYSIKTLKKLKIDQFSKSLTILFEQATPYDYNPLLTNQSKVDDIIQLTNFLVECIRQLEKVESSGMMGTIKQYQDKLYPHEHRKKLSKIIQYQKYVAQYYQVQELIKKFTLSIRQMALKEFGVRVNLIIDENMCEDGDKN